MVGKRIGLVGCLGLVCVSAPVFGQVRITEYMYSGGGLEFIEFTNLGANPVDMAGWSYDDDSAIPGTVDLSAFGVVNPGQSVVLAEAVDTDFITDWGLAGVSVIGGLTTNLGRNDQINLFDAGGVLVDRLTFGDQNIPGTIRTQNISGWPCADGVGADDITKWQLSVVSDAQNSYAAVSGDIGNPGSFVSVACQTCGNNVVEGNEECDGSEVGNCQSGTCNPDCTCVPAPVPTVSEWGLVILTLVGLTAGTILFGRSRLTAQ